MAELDQAITGGYGREISSILAKSLEIPASSIDISNNRDVRFSNITLRGFDIALKDPQSLAVLRDQYYAEVSVENGSTKIKIPDHMLERLVDNEKDTHARADNKRIERDFSATEMRQLLDNLTVKDGSVRSQVAIALGNGKTKTEEVNFHVDTDGGVYARYTSIPTTVDAMANAAGFFLGGRTTKNWTPEQKILAMQEELKLPEGTSLTDPRLARSMEAMARMNMAREIKEDRDKLYTGDFHVNSIYAHYPNTPQPGETSLSVSLSDNQRLQLGREMLKVLDAELQRNGTLELLKGGQGSSIPHNAQGQQGERQR